MSFKFNPNAGEEKKFVSKAGTYQATVSAAKIDWLPPRSDLMMRLTFTTTDGEMCFGEIFAKPDKDGGHSRLESFLASTATEDEVKRYIDSGNIEVDEDFIRMISERSVGRNLKIKVTERKYLKKDGSEGVSYSASFFNRLPDGPEGPF